MSRKAVESLTNENERMAGILVHPTSFPSVYGIGDLGKEAYQFIDFLADSGQKIWQVLPLGPTGFGDSPYQSFSSFAGQPLLISPDKLKDDMLLVDEDFIGMPQWNEKNVEYGSVITYKKNLLKKAYDAFTVTPNQTLIEEYRKFCTENSYWLEDYSLFMAGKQAHEGSSWLEWEDSLKSPTEEEKKSWVKKLQPDIKYYEFIQFIFFRQWLALKNYANSRGILIIGDIPIFVALDSADVWANKKFFQLDSKGYPLAVAGVPPDYFSATGQLWGNPLYDWDALKKDGYSWWIKRVEYQLKITDYLRIDHFRGFEAYWAVPYGEETAVNGEWKKGPFKDLFYALQKSLGEQLPILAEDLGIITKEVEELRDAFQFPGMKILQFAFDNTEDNNFLPHHYSKNCICYTGTHDNDTTVGWYSHANDYQRERCRMYMNSHSENIEEICWNFIRTALGSVAKFAIIPIQDLLCEGSEKRMNTPSTADGNWSYRFRQEALSKQLSDKLRNLTRLYGR